MMHVHAWRPAVLAALIPAMALCAAPAFAQGAPAAGPDAASLPHIAVQYGDLDLTSAKGRHVLDRRLRQSAASVCDYDGAQHRNLSRDGERACYDKALAHAHVTLAAALNKSRMASNQ